MADNKIAFCQWTFNRDFNETKLCIERVSPHVDAVIINYNKPITEENLKWLIDNLKIHKIYFLLTEFKDNFPEQRNIYLEKAKKLGMNWICVSDPDELYSEKLAKNLRTLINTYDKDDYQVISVPCQDQFDCVEWLDKLDLLKECPAGYRETNYWKPMLIFKLFDDIKYEGVGVEKNVHETLNTRYKRRTINLPKEYFYVHKKSSLKIWRNAARNMFIGGGGDNVGSKNILWTELKQFCSKININNWNVFEKFINEGFSSYIINNINTDIVKHIRENPLDLKDEWRLWLESALKASPTKEGTETRETAKWYFALHKDEVDKRIDDLIKKVPELSQETELENYVTQMYYQLLGRHPDEGGKHYYVNRILNGEIKRTDLINIFRNSDEFKEKFGSLVTSKNNIINDNIAIIDSKYDKIRYKKIEDFVSKMYTRILEREVDNSGKAYYTKAIMDEIIKPSDLAEIFIESNEYKNRFATPFIMNILNKEESILRMQSLSGKINETSLSNKTNKMRKPFNFKASKVQLKYRKSDTSKHNTIALCIMGFKKGLSMIKESINIIGNKMDEIHIQGDDFDNNDIKELNSLGYDVQVHTEPWIDDFSDYKNKAISHAKTEWVLILDHDEVPTEELSKELRNIIKSSNIGNNYDMVSFDVIDVATVNGNPVSQNRNRGGKPLLHWNIPYPYYGNPHIWIRQNYYPWKEIHSNVAYKHIKEQGTELERSVRNIFMGGGGDNSKEKNPLWIKLRNICNELEIKTYSEFDSYLKRGTINRRLLDIIVELSKMNWKDEELKDIIKYYIILHPEEKEFIEKREYKQKEFGDKIS